MIYYNENDPFAAAWLRELMAAGVIPEGVVDERSVVDVQPDDVRGYGQCHWFAGVSGWAEALRLAGWGDRPVWSGSVPCQPFSVAGKRQGTEDERHLWPEFLRLIEACQPQAVFGEQVVSSEVVGAELEAAFVAAVQRGDYAAANRAANRLVKSPTLGAELRWLDGVFADLEGLGYACRAADLPAACVASPHRRQRLFWGAQRLADSIGDRIRLPGRRETGVPSSGVQGETRQRERVRDDVGAGGGGEPVRLADRDGHRWSRTGSRRVPGVEAKQWGKPQFDARHGRVDGRMVDSLIPRLEGHAGNGDGGDEPGRLGADAAGSTAEAGDAGGLGDAPSGGRGVSGHEAQPASGGHAVGAGGTGHGFWSDCDVIHCRDGKHRRIPRQAQPGVQPVADGLQAGVDGVRAACESRHPLAGKIPNRTGLLRGAGNAIVPQVAAAFVAAFMDSIQQENNDG